MAEVAVSVLTEVAVVSCDILGHSAAEDDLQFHRVAEINRIVGDAIERREPGQVIWSSGGDGGHVIFFGDDWLVHAVHLMAELCAWARDESVQLRVTGHVGPVRSLVGADGRTQVVGSGINFAGWLVRQATGDGIVVSDAFRRAIASASIASEVTIHHQRLLVNRGEEKLLYLLSFDGVQSEWGNPEDDDYASLRRALQSENGWDALYYAKRISQINPQDRNVTAALEHASRMLKSGTGANRSFLELLRADELTEMLKLGHLVERRPGEVICRVGEPGESMFVILRGEVGVYNLEGKGFGGTAEANNVHRAGEVVGELATALKRNRTADLIARTDVALLSFISDEVTDKLSDTDAGKEARRQYDLFILDRVLQHTVQATPYLLGPLNIPSSQGFARVTDRKPWEAAVRELLPHTELVTVAPGGFTLDNGQVVRAMSKEDPEHGLFVLVSGSVTSSTPVVAKLDGSRSPLLWVDVPELFDAPPSTYKRAAEPIMVLRIGAKGVDQLSLDQRGELLRSLKSVVGEVPPEYQFDVYLCHSSLDKEVVSEIKDRLWEDYGLRSWYDDAELQPGDSTRKAIEKGLMSSRFLLLCASANLNSSDWANREIDSVLHLDVKRQNDDPKVLVLKLYEHETNDEAIPRLLRGTKRHHLQREGDFERLAGFIQAAGRAASGRRGP
ncbi:cyclic nucleotide-binding protein [Saccharothrix saharensis]|uniref:Cyclic nucleotide-binding protein n=1 Tax=Saccharothrix saharensis TaxID=571190 RepID=A0A543JK18_9PSEU|nr:TIR domain-containing protein [Saccharothrix saharensis]TQM83098.1 cyclic nucleotide-binding protein [Saccharothrix saharensis]